MKRLVVILALSVAVAAAAQPGFDPNEVVRQVRPTFAHQHRGPNRGNAGPAADLDGNEFLLDTSTALAGAAANQYGVAVGSDGTNYLVAWADLRSNEYGAIFGARVTADGIVLDPTGIAITTTADEPGYPTIAFDGTNFLVVWQDYRGDSTADVYGARVSTAGVVLDPQGFAISTAFGEQEAPRLAFGGANYLAIWEDDRRGNDYDVYGARIAPSGQVLDTAGFPISTATGAQFRLDLAFDGTNFLAVWEDTRNGSRADIYGARITAAGTVLDTAGIPVSRATNDQQSPSVAFGGSDYLVCWTDSRISSTDCDVYAARVTPGGAVLDTAGFVISAAADAQFAPAAAFGGTNFMVAWSDARSGFWRDIYGARITPGGTVLDTAGFSVSSAAYSQNDPALAWGGTNWLVVWEDQRLNVQTEIYGARVAPAGTVLDPQGINIATAAYSQEAPAVAFDGANYLVVWQDSRSDTSVDLYGTRVTPGGTVLDPAGIAISTAPGSQGEPALAFNGTNFLVAWDDRRDSLGQSVYMARVTTSGTVLDPAGIPISTRPGPRMGPAVASDGTNWLVAYSDYQGGDYADLFGVRISPTGAMLDTAPFPISAAERYQMNPALAFDGTNFMAVWNDSRHDADDIYCARISPAGNVLDTAGIVVSRADDWQMVPALAFDGTNFLAVWEDARSGLGVEIYGARITPAGTVLDTAGIAILINTGEPAFPAIGFDGTNYLVAWEDYRTFPTSDIYGARVTPAGSVTTTGPIARQAGDQCNPALAHGAGSQMFLAYDGWVDQFGGRTYSTKRIWGTLTPDVGIQVGSEPAVSSPAPGTSIIHNVLLMPEARGGERNAICALLVDVTGRKALDLYPGANDVSRLGSGVYFLHATGERDRVVASKIIVQN